MPADQGARARRHTWATLFLVVVLLAASPALPVQPGDPSPTADPGALQQKLRDLRQRAAEQRAKIGLLDDRQAALASQLDGLAAELAELETQGAEARSRAAGIRPTTARAPGER